MRASPRGCRTPGIVLMTAFTCWAVIKRVHSNCRGLVARAPQKVLVIEPHPHPPWVPNPRNCLDDSLHLFGRDQARTFELPRPVLMARAPQKVLVIEPHPHVIPAGLQA